MNKEQFLNQKAKDMSISQLAAAIKMKAVQSKNAEINNTLEKPKPKYKASDFVRLSGTPGELCWDNDWYNFPMVEISELMTPINKHHWDPFDDKIAIIKTGRGYVLIIKHKDNLEFTFEEFMEAIKNA